MEQLTIGSDEVLYSSITLTANKANLIRLATILSEAGFSHYLIADIASSCVDDQNLGSNIQVPIDSLFDLMEVITALGKKEEVLYTEFNKYFKQTLVAHAQVLAASEIEIEKLQGQYLIYRFGLIENSIQENQDRLLKKGIDEMKLNKNR